MSYFREFFYEKEFIFFIWEFLLRNCQILLVFQSSFTSNSFRIRSYPDPDWFLPYPDPAKSFRSDRIRIHNTAVHKKSTALLRHARDNLRGQKSLGPLKMSLETAQKVIVPQKKNYVPHFLKQQDINSYLNSELLVHGLKKVIRTSSCRWLTCRSFCHLQFIP